MFEEKYWEDNRKLGKIWRGKVLMYSYKERK
jgi:hypothetical protein